MNLFALMMGISVSYKSVERLYSDTETKLALYNLFVLVLKKRGISVIDACGDATGYALTITKHYSSYVQKRKEKAKEQDECKKKAFVYQFALMDLHTGMYACHGTSLRSERRAFDMAVEMLKDIDVKMRSLRLDRYYSQPCYVNLFPDTLVYIIPHKNAKLGHGLQWFFTIRAFMQDTMGYLKEYFRRNHLETNFMRDKRMFGWKVEQKREDRIDTALFV